MEQDILCSSETGLFFCLVLYLQLFFPISGTWSALCGLSGADPARAEHGGEPRASQLEAVPAHVQLGGRQGKGGAEHHPTMVRPRAQRRGGGEQASNLLDIRFSLPSSLLLPIPSLLPLSLSLLMPSFFSSLPSHSFLSSFLSLLW